jgi:hypothetical protein
LVLKLKEDVAMKKMGVIALMVLVLCCTTLLADDVEVSNLQPTQNATACFRLFPTNNIWTFLKLDTRTGLAWQVQFGLESPTDRLTVVLNDIKLAPDTSKEGRFTLYPTRNIFNFLLIDQQTGQTWQLQWSQKQKERGIWLIPQTQ